MAVAGDIALVGYGADAGVKSFAFVLLADLAGQTLYFTDNGWLAAGGFRANEGTVSYTVPADATIGTVVTISGLTGMLNPSASGDQILAYTGSAANPTFLFALNFADGKTAFASDATSSNTSAVPTGLTAGATALAFGDDNGAYTGPTTGSRAEILAAIADAKNWTTNDTAGVAYASGFTVGGGSNAGAFGVADIAVDEGDAGTTDLTFTVTRDDGSDGEVTVNYAATFGSADADDIVGTLPAGTLTFAAGETAKTVTITVAGDTVRESDETIALTLTEATGGATIADAAATGTIVNDDGTAPAVSIGDVSVVEGDAGQTLATFTVTRTGGDGAFSVAYETMSNTATAGSDFVGADGRIDFAAGQQTATISIAVNGDTVREGNEKFYVALSDATDGATLTDSLGEATIVNDDLFRIHDVQGGAFFSPVLTADGVGGFNIRSTTTVTVQAVVTALDGTGARQGFYLTEETADWDTSALTSEGIFVMARDDRNAGTTLAALAPNLRVGDLVTVTAQVMEYQAFTNMPRTVLTGVSGITVDASNQDLPTLILDGSPGRAIPSAILTDEVPNYFDSVGGAGFDPANDALDFFETIEGMRVTVPDMVVADGFVGVSGGKPFLKAYSTVHADADQINSRGGYTIGGDPKLSPPDTADTRDDVRSGGRYIHDGDTNPDILELDFTDFATAAPAALVTAASAGDKLGDVTGIVEFDFTDLKLFVTDPVTIKEDVTPVREVTTIVADARALTIGTFNVENLAATDADARFTAIADAIAVNLKTPDILTIEEIQDNNGATAGDGTSSTGTDASLTWQKLVDAVNAATGQRYQWVDELPVYNAEGGQPNGNIRVGFLYNTNRVQLGDLAADATIEQRRTFTDRIGDGVRDAGDRIGHDDSQIAGQINAADWTNTRKSLLGQFSFAGNDVYVAANHLPSKGGSGEFWQLDQNIDNGQPTNAGWAKRNAIAEDVWHMLDTIQSASSDNRIVAGGDWNEFYFNRAMEAATGYVDANGTARDGGARFDNLTVTELTEAERYTYMFDGRSQAIDHVIVDQQLGAVASYDVVHINTGYNNRGGTNPALSDHDPALAQFDFRNFGERLRGTAAIDRIEGLGGDDRIEGLAGNDQLFGGDGNDLLIGGAGSDTMWGGAGSDAFFYDATGAGGKDRIKDFSSEDFLVTTVRLRDNNKNGLIAAGSNKVFDLSGGGSIAIEGVNGSSVRTIEYDGMLMKNGVAYYIYSMVGSTTDPVEALAVL